MNQWQNIKLYARKFATWTPADIFCSIRPSSSDTYAIFRRKIQLGNLGVLFISVMMMGVLLDVLTAINILLSEKETNQTYYVNRTRLLVFVILSGLNIAYHPFFLLLNCINFKKCHIAKYQIWISAISFFILVFQINQIQLLNRSQPVPPVEVWITLGLLEGLLAGFYFQESFVFSMVCWTIVAVWVSGGDTETFSLQVRSACMHTYMAHARLAQHSIARIYVGTVTVRNTIIVQCHAHLKICHNRT